MADDTSLPAAHLISPVDEGDAGADFVLPPLPTRSRRSAPSKRFLTVDVASEFFPKHRLDELAQLYAQVFNGVEGVTKKWTPQMSKYLLDERLQRPGSLIALFDRQTDSDATQMKMI